MRGGTPHQRFEALLERFGKLMRHAIARRLPPGSGIAIDDLEQDARLRLWQALQKQTEIHNPASFLYRVGVTTALDALRRAAVRPRAAPQRETGTGREQEMDATIANGAPTPERRAEHKEAARVVLDGMASLAEARRRAVGLHLQGLTTNEIATLLGWTEPKARNLVYRGLRDLRQELEARGIHNAAG